MNPIRRFFPLAVSARSQEVAFVAVGADSDHNLHAGRAYRLAEVGCHANRLGIFSNFPQQHGLISRLSEIINREETPPNDRMLMGRALMPLEAAIDGHHTTFISATQALDRYDPKVLSLFQVAGSPHYDLHMLGAFLAHYFVSQRDKGVFNIAHWNTVPNLYSNALTLLVQQSHQFEPEVARLIHETAKTSTDLAWKMTFWANAQGEEDRQKAAALLAAVGVTRMVSKARALFRL